MCSSEMNYIVAISNNLPKFAYMSYKDLFAMIAYCWSHNNIKFECRGEVLKVLRDPMLS